MDLGLVWVLRPKVIGWLGGTGVVLLDRDLRMENSFEELERWSALDKVSSQRWRLNWEEAEVIWEFRIGIWGFVGSDRRRVSRSFVSLATSGRDWGIKSLRKSAGIACFEALSRALRNVFSPVEQDEGGGREEKVRSVSKVKRSQSAFLKLKYVLIGRGF